MSNTNITNVTPVNMCNYTKILPLVYSDSLSYYEDVCKLVEKTNELIDYINKLLTDYIVQLIQEQFNNLLIDTIYDSETEDLTLYLKEVV